MKLPAIRLSRLWPFLVWCVVGVILFWPVRGYYVALPAPDSPPFFPAAYRLRYVEQFLAGNTALSPHHLFSLLLPPLIHHDLIYLIDTLLIAAGVAYLLRGRGLPGPTPGDQFVVLEIVLPPDSPRARQFFEQMKRELPFDPRAEDT